MMMASVIQTFTAYEQRSVIRFLWSKGKTPEAIHGEMYSTYGKQCFSLGSIECWCRWFQEGREDLHDDDSSGRSPSSVTDNDAMLNEGRHKRSRDISQNLDKSYGSAQDVVQGSLGNRKVTSVRTCSWRMTQRLPDLPS